MSSINVLKAKKFIEDRIALDMVTEKAKLENLKFIVKNGFRCNGLISCGECIFFTSRPPHSIEKPPNWLCLCLNSSVREESKEEAIRVVQKLYDSLKILGYYDE